MRLFNSLVRKNKFNNLRNRDTINIYGENLKNHFFITEIEEMAKRFRIVRVFLFEGLSNISELNFSDRFPNVLLIHLTRNERFKFKNLKSFCHYSSLLMPWNKMFDLNSVRSAVFNIIIGWKIACQIEDLKLWSNLNLSFWGFSPEYLVALKCLKPGTIVGTRLHSKDLYFSFAGHWQLTTRLNALNNLDFVAPISLHGAQALIQSGVTVTNRVSYLGCRRNEYIVNRVKKTLHDGHNRPLKIATVAMIHPRKRLDYTIEVISRLKHSVIWHHYGRPSDDTDYVEKIRILAQTKTSKKHQFEFFGDVSNDNLRKSLATEAYDFVLLLSESEGVPVSLMEALAADIRIVVTDTYGCPELVEKEIGCLIPIQSTIDECALTIENWWTRSKNKPSGMAYDQWSRKFNATKLYDDFADFLLSC